MWLVIETNSAFRRLRAGIFNMKNKLNLTATLLILLTLIIGCSSYNPLSDSSDSGGAQNKDLSERAIDSTIGEEKIGVAECDEIIDFFAEQAKSEDDDFVTKAARGYAMNKIREGFKRSIEENKGDTVKMAKECKSFKRELDKYKPAGNSNNK
jgi:hypothetical protein